SAPRRHIRYAGRVAQRLDDRAAPPARAPEPSVPYGDRPTPIVDISREVAAAAAASDMRATSRLRTSQIAGLLKLTQDDAPVKDEGAVKDEAAAKDDPAPSLVETSPLTSAAPPAQPRSVAVPVALGVAALALALVAVYTRTHPKQAAAVAAPSVVAPTIPASPITPAVAQTTLAAPAAGAAEVQAREVLNRLRTGLDGCIRNGIHALPGGSPPVPPGLDALKEGAFTPAPGDWKTAVWSCAQFQTTEPMTFQLQWQLVKPSAEGMGIAWIDQDHDGVADRALGFSITLGPQSTPILGEIREIDAATPVRR
ncbi:MAG: hypothetical protein ABJE95_29980, partial [Byssovorax sp.]